MGMQEITEGSMALEQKQRRILTIEAAEKSQAIRLRVAAYARVSSSSEDQLNSFEAQRRRYTELITSKENWAFVDLYADEGITGTSAEKRPDFQRMLADCRRGLIDRILVKSISRFARNTKECLETTRELKLLGISVRFEEQNIDTANMTGEMMTAVFASMAQAESESISGNMRWSYQKRMQAGIFIPPQQPYGYILKDGRIEIDPQRAQIVKKVFDDYLSGVGIQKIAEDLNREYRHSRNGDAKWTAVTVSRILKNEKYAGDSLWQKTYRTDTLPRKGMVNRGERTQYFAEATHPGIVDRESYHQARELLNKQNETGAASDEITYSPFKGKMVCGCCGMTFRQKTIRGQVYRVCLGHVRDKKSCPVPPVIEENLKAAFLRLYFNLKQHGEPILLQTIDSLTVIRERRMLWSEDIIALNRQISELASQIKMLTKLKEQRLIDPDIYISQSNELTKQLRDIKLKKERLLDQDGDTSIRDTQEILDTLEDGPDQLDAFDADLFQALIDKIIVESGEQLRFRLRNGLELPESMEMVMR